jgi:hypothetical protein
MCSCMIGPTDLIYFLSCSNSYCGNLLPVHVGVNMSVHCLCLKMFSFLLFTPFIRLAFVNFKIVPLFCNTHLFDVGVDYYGVALPFVKFNVLHIQFPCMNFH